MESVMSIFELQNVEWNILIIKTIVISIYTYILDLRIINKKLEKKVKEVFILLILIVLSIVCIRIRTETDYFISIICLLFGISVLLAKIKNNNIGNSILVTTISLSINYVLFTIAAVVVFLFNIISNIIFGYYMNFTVMIIIYTFLLKILLSIPRFKNGFAFLQNHTKNDYIDVLVLNICAIILFLNIILSNYDKLMGRSIFFGFIIFAIIMFITIQKSLQLYYKQKLLIQDLEETKKELENKTKEVEELEKENLEFSKKSHTLAHRQKALQYKIQEILTKTEASKEEAAEVKDKLKEVEKDLYTETVVTELSKTEIAEIDNMLKYMQSECKKNKIDMDLQIKGNIHYMTNNLISKDDLEILIADHLKNAIIAINHTDNVNRSILVRLGKIDGIYSLYIYDTGIEFEVETLKKLGKEPSTTHKEEGGTGMGFMNTFDTLRKCKASMIIKEIAKPSKDNFTKALIIKFDNKNKFEIDSYRNIDYDENISQDDQSG